MIRSVWIEIYRHKNKYVNVKFSFSTIFRIIRFSIRKRKYVKLTIAHRQTSEQFSKWGQIQAYWSHQNVKCFLNWTDNTVKSSTIRIWDIYVYYIWIVRSVLLSNEEKRKQRQKSVVWTVKKTILSSSSSFSFYFNSFI